MRHGGPVRCRPITICAGAFLRGGTSARPVRFPRCIALLWVAVKKGRGLIASLRRHIAGPGDRVADGRDFGTFSVSGSTPMGAAVADVSRGVVNARVASIGEVAITGRLVAVGSTLVNIGGRLIAVGARLVAVGERLIVFGQGLTGFESSPLA